MTESRLVVGVTPGAELVRRKPLFRALEAVLGVSFVEAEDASAPECVVVIGAAPPLGARRVLQYPADAPPSGEAVGDVVFGDCLPLDPRLRRRSLKEQSASITRELEASDLVMAAGVNGAPIWTKRRGDVEVDAVAHGAPILRDGEALRDHLSPGRFIALLPMIHFLREAVAEGGRNVWEPPPLRATFIVDDPNLRRTTYGPLDYLRLAADARERDYHIGLATVPLDARMASPSAARIFREHADVLSLSIHGNDHDGGELGKRMSREETARVLAQALRRIERLEERRKVAVSRVMVPPHEACVPEALSMLMLLGYDGVCMTRPHPWIGVGDQVSPYATSAEDVDAGWGIAVMRSDGFPVLLRRRFAETDEIVLRAYLDQPLILYGHIGDLLAGLDPIRAAAAEINSLGHVHWCSLGELAASNYLIARPERGRLLVKPFSRRIEVSDLSAVEEVEILWPAACEGQVRVVQREAGGRTHAEYRKVGAPLHVRDCATAIEAAFVPAGAVDHASIGARRTTARALARRIVTEARDRALPRVRRLQSS